MKILIDARFYGLENAGIGRYVMNLIDNLVLQDKDGSYLILLKKKYYENLDFPKNWKKILVDIPHYSLKEQIFLPKIINKENPDIVHFPNFNTPIFYQGKYIATIHDLIKHSSRGPQTTTRNPLLYWFKYLAYKIVFDNTIRSAKKIIVPSQTVKEELISEYPNSKDKIVVTYEGVDGKYLLEDGREKLEDRKKILEKYNIKKPFIIYTGSVYPHKNIERLIQTVGMINKEISLVISCSRSVFWERIKPTNYVKMVGFVPDSDLKVIYQEAEAFVFPTLAEGFGLPGLEAMASNCPVICSNLPVLKEIYGDAAIYFDPHDINNMAKVISGFCFGSQKEKEKMKLLGLTQVKKYSWEKMAKETLREYNKFKK